MRAVLTALFSERYPSVGESHGLSVLSGQIRRDCTGHLDRLEILDMVAIGRDARDELIELVSEVQPNLLGISVTYGTYSKLAEVVPLLRAVLSPDCQIAYGGPLATYLAADILDDIDPNGVVFVGEGEWALAAFLNEGLNRCQLPNIGNVAFLDETGQFVQATRTLTNALNLAQPDRRHLAELVPLGIQLYAETSRGCSWAHCTFCLRGLLDLEGVGGEFRRMPVERLINDIAEIKALGGASLTFADEDLLGNDGTHANQILEMLEAVGSATSGPFRYDASATVHSVYAANRPHADQTEREGLIARLASVGLRKIFLGVESGSPTQLRRYAKGHSPAEAAAAIQLLRRHNIVVELGWIMFDPLCTLSEARENLEFLLECEAVDATSYLFNELRLQRGTRFERLLDTHARRTGERLHGSEFDRDTLSYDYCYADPRIATLVQLTRTWAESLRPIHYPLKNLTRYGAAGALAGQLDLPREILSELRKGMCHALLAEIERLEHGNEDLDPNSVDMLLRRAATRLIDWANCEPSEVREMELVRVLLQNSSSTIAAPGLDENSQLANKV